MTITPVPMTYDMAVRSFDHAPLAALPAYARLRQALSDIANEAAEQGGMKLSEFLDAVRDMAATAPYGDMCMQCGKACECPPDALLLDTCLAHRTWWPHAAERDGGWITGTYRCSGGHTWPCGYAINIAGMF